MNESGGRLSSFPLPTAKGGTNIYSDCDRYLNLITDQTATAQVSCLDVAHFTDPLLPSSLLLPPPRPLFTFFSA